MILQPVTVDNAPSSLASCTFHPNVPLSFYAGVRPWSCHLADLNFFDLCSSTLHVPWLLHPPPLLKPHLAAGFQTFPLLCCFCSVGSLLWLPRTSVYSGWNEGQITTVLLTVPSKYYSSCSSFFPLALVSHPGLSSLPFSTSILEVWIS